KKILKSSGNITMVVDNLEDKGLVERRKDLDDRRYSMVHLTEKGRSTVEKILPGHVQAIQEMLCVLTESEQERLGRLCKKLGLSATEYS
ncbi:MAG: MarR family transcriptional regulator, partial [candidate division Zixibacteria bacterium]|nr:MarR family transcriptional regulator [Gammaproteobacteria bacterium]NIR64466.1 MarR family transcriptional regulator [candidate division Zixibacteria bacterium]NIS46418.1 MarR family transcriptional regulator [candidate division Zixibacteria bacterium]NIU14465.1 MarR family transcriptional regulator [candidate division Zixibacteria bacterium]NIV06497.1 MarR family transcriptional regulator [candidate division Zixibacteria bacterium]